MRGPLIALLALGLLGCETEVRLGAHHHAAAPLGPHLVQLDPHHVHGVGGIPVSVVVRRGPKPWGLRLTARLTTADGLEVDVVEGDVVPIGLHSWQVLAITAVLREGHLVEPRVRLRRLPG